MYSCAGETDEDSEFRRSPLGGWSPAVGATVVGIGFLDLEKLKDNILEGNGNERREEEDMIGRIGMHTLERVSGSTSHMALLAMLAFGVCCSHAQIRE